MFHCELNMSLSYGDSDVGLALVECCLLIAERHTNCCPSIDQ